MAITRANILKEINRLQEALPPDPPPELPKHVLWVYARQTLGELQKIISNSEKYLGGDKKNKKKNLPRLLGELQDFLAKNWEFVKETTLDPATIRDENIAKLLWDVANYVSQKQKLMGMSEPLSPIQLLKPGINIDSMYATPPTLQTCIESAMTRLEENWERDNRVEGESSADTIPPEELEPLETQADQIGTQELKKFTKLAQEYPNLDHLSFEEFRHGFISYGPDSVVSVRAITGSMNKDHDDYVDESLCTDYGYSPESFSLGKNAYYDVVKPGDLRRLYIDAEAYHRLIQHSPLTQAVHNARAALYSLQHDKNHLFGQLKNLLEKFGFESKHGTGTEYNAGQGIYPAVFIPHFYNFQNIGNNSNNSVMSKKQQFPPSCKTKFKKYYG